jgi:cytochrome c biogenesis protein CcdA
MHFGWLLAVGVNILGLLNLLTLLSPQIRERYMAYLQTLSQSMALATPTASLVSVQTLQQKMMTQMMGPILGLSAVFILFVLVLLWRARWAYKSNE